MQRHLRPSLSVVKTAKSFAIVRSAATAAILLCLLLASTAIGWAQQTLRCPEDTGNPLKPYGDLLTNYQTNLVVDGQCDVTTSAGQMGPLLYVFENVNIINNGKLVFHDDYDIDFYAENILVEYGGSLIATSTQAGYLPQVSQLAGVLPYTKRLTVHLWGAAGDPGAVCASPVGPNNAPCGIPNNIAPPMKTGLWDSNPIMAMDLMMNPPPPPPLPKNAPCAPSAPAYSKYLPGNDCFYRYEIQDAADQQTGRPAYFGHKVLAVSFGGTLQLFGSDGVTYLMQGQKCMPGVVGNECNPANTGTSWRRLVKVAQDQQTGNWQLYLDAPTGSTPVNWKSGDEVVVTTTDYLPSHSEVRTLTADASDNVLTINKKLTYDHNVQTYGFSDVPNNVGPQDDPNKPDLHREIDTRAVVALLTRNIQIVSQGDKPSEPFTEKPENFYGGHTIVRQGFLSYQVQGVEFRQLGQGGAKGRYSVHFHMLRKTAQPVPTDDDPTPEPLNYLKDCSINVSMTRWVTIHATQGMYIARNIGYKSIGHGYYLEDATEVNNKIYSNVGIFARAAIINAEHNPRKVPGILADNTVINPLGNGDYMPFRSDYNHPSVFWITNGWNDFEYNFAAGAATCGACYWWLGTGVSGPSQYQTWDGYASEQVVTDRNTNYLRAGITPLKDFKGNSCVAAMTSFQMNQQTAECLGVYPPNGSGGLIAVKSSAPPGIPSNDLGPDQPFQVYYPVMTDVHSPAICTNRDCSANSANIPNSPCNALDSYNNCAVTHIDRYTSSFNFAQTNFAAIWLRKGWDLVTNSAVTDVQTGGLNFITGGGFTRSDVGLGEWMLARDNILVGHTQPESENPYALDVGPFNAASGLQCTNSDANNCQYPDGGMAFNLPAFPGQKLLNIYDGPSHQVGDAFADINVATVPDCTPQSGGNCSSSAVPLARNIGVLANTTDSSCYLPNAAIAWKQPNGFYYPPAFHSRDLWFRNVDIRHFVVEPLFLPVKPLDSDPFMPNQDAVNDRYCTRSSNMFMSFDSIDRETVLNDDDGTLTGLVGALQGVGRPSISINEDPYFNSPVTTPECLSDINVKPPLSEQNPLPKGLVPTARTSPYEWLTTAIAPDCVGTGCYDPSDNTGHWWLGCTTQACRGVPLYREYLTSTESAGAPPQIRMMGQSTGQRSTLSLNYGAYYLDTTQNCTSQNGCVPCAEKNPDGKSCKTWGPVTSNPSVFTGGHTYYVFLLYATDTTKQKYDIYVGPTATQAEVNVQPVYVDANTGNFATSKPADGSYVTPDYSKLSQGIVSVSVDLTGQGSIFEATKADFCRPKSYCSYNSTTKTCGCNPNNPDCDPKANDCSWAVNDIDCPENPNNLNSMNCFGFAFTLPADFTPQPAAPAESLFVPFVGAENSPPYFKAGNVTFEDGLHLSPSDECVYDPPPAP